MGVYFLTKTDSEKQPSIIKIDVDDDVAAIWEDPNVYNHSMLIYVCMFVAVKNQHDEY